MEATPTATTATIPPERWVGRQLQEITALACTAEATITRDSERLALVLGHVLAHGRHEPGTCEECDAGRAWLEVWLAGGADAPRELVELRRVAGMGATGYAQHWHAQGR